ncbi:alpha/beta hydrolase [Lentibacillus saliphilus]|uniref:alpha/beta hydrolase n=1 Tax=Lentibacillus saliphilus TaxID=2737028 RepID=UPI001C2F354A|nr:alpha/beta hydrolase [Lentibacillus saliphilus]
MNTTFVYKEVDQCSIKAELYPVDQPNAPLIIYIHGGGLVWGTREDINKEQVALYNQAGYNILSIAYRLAPETKLPNIIDDIRDAVKWVYDEGHKHMNFNTEKVAVIGSSAGAYLALMTGTFPVKPKAIVSFYGYGDILGDWYLQPSAHFLTMTNVPEVLAKQLIQPNTIAESPIQRRYAIYLFCRQQGKWLDYVADMGTTSNEDALKQFCPVLHVDATYPPTLLLHGDVDEDVPYEESLKMKEALDQAGVFNELITIPNGKHTFDEHMDDPIVKDAFDRVINFLNKQL